LVATESFIPVKGDEENKEKEEVGLTAISSSTTTSGVTCSDEESRGAVDVEVNNIVVISSQEKEVSSAGLSNV
jgi:hypothetical protein